MAGTFASSLISRKTRVAPRIRRHLSRLLLLLSLIVAFFLLSKFSFLTLSLTTLPTPAAHFPKTCIPDRDRRAFHSSLRRGPSRAEVRARPQARQPRDALETWTPISRGIWHDAHLPPRRLVDVDEADASYLYSATRTALASARADIPDAHNASATRAYIRLSRAGRQAAVAVQVARPNRAIARRIVTLTHPLGAPCTVGLTRPNGAVPLHIVFPYGGRPNRLRAALGRLRVAARSEQGHRIRAVIAASGDDLTFASQTVKSLGLGEIVRVVHVGGDANGKFSRAVALRDAVQHVPADEVVFFADVDLMIGQSFFRDCRINLVRGSQVWFPVFFSLFPYGRGVNTRDGFWRTSSYGMVCMFRSDFDAVSGFGGDEEKRYAGWGSEDVDLYNRFRENPQYAVFRSLEPELLHVWHGKHCERNEHYANCMRTVFMTIASQGRLAEIVADSGVDTSSLTKNALPL